MRNPERALWWEEEEEGCLDWVVYVVDDEKTYRSR